MHKYSQAKKRQDFDQLKYVIHLFTFVAIGFIGVHDCNSSASAAPCFPNDPDGTNPGNLCLTYPPSWSPLPNTFTDQPPFVQGTGQPAYYGYPVSPTQPGRIIGRTEGYWTGVEAINGKTTITDSNGNAFTAP